MLSCDMFLVTFACANEYFSGENNFETHPVIEFVLFWLWVWRVIGDSIVIKYCGSLFFKFHYHSNIPVSIDISVIHNFHRMINSFSVTDQWCHVFCLKPILLPQPSLPGQCWNPQIIVVTWTQHCKGGGGREAGTCPLHVPCLSGVPRETL